MSEPVQATCLYWGYTKINNGMTAVLYTALLWNKYILKRNWKVFVLIFDIQTHDIKSQVELELQCLSEGIMMSESNMKTLPII